MDGTLAGLDLGGTTYTDGRHLPRDPWTFTDVTGNYNDTSGTVDDIIAKADADCSSITGYAVTYDSSATPRPGPARASGRTGPLAGLDLSARPTPLAGTYHDDPWTFTDVTGNYNDTSGTVDDAIAKADADCSSITGYSVTYDTLSHTATGTCEGVGMDGPWPASTCRARPTPTAGTYDRRSWTFTDVTGNYNDTSGTVDDVIAKANADCSSITGYSVTYDTLSHTATGPARASARTAPWPGSTCRHDPHRWPAPTTTIRGRSPTSPATTTTPAARSMTPSPRPTPTELDHRLRGDLRQCSHTATGTCDGRRHGRDPGRARPVAARPTPLAGTYMDDPGRSPTSPATTTTPAARSIDASPRPTPTQLDHRLRGDLRQCSHTATGTCDGRRHGRDPGRPRPVGTTHTNGRHLPRRSWTFTDVTGNYNDTSGTVDDDRQGRRRLQLDHRLRGDLRRFCPHRDRDLRRASAGRDPGRPRPQRHDPHQRPAPTRRPGRSPTSPATTTMRAAR